MSSAGPDRAAVAEEGGVAIGRRDDAIGGEVAGGAAKKGGAGDPAIQREKVVASEAAGVGIAADLREARVGELGVLAGADEIVGGVVIADVPDRVADIDVGGEVAAGAERDGT